MNLRSEHIKGKLFEFFVFRLLYSCGFDPVIPDGDFVYGEMDKLMVHGLGSSHNADVLMSPPVQIPCMYPIRLLVECKCYNKRIGLPIIRNALGLRHDINAIEIVSEKILHNRSGNSTRKERIYKMNRYQYQVAVAAIDDFTQSTFPFAATHRIPLISFAKSSIFENIRKLLNEIDIEAKHNSGYAHEIRDRIRELMENPRWMVRRRFENSTFDVFCNQLLELEKDMAIGLLTDGTILFLKKSYDIAFRDSASRYDDGFSIHWYSEEDSTWLIRFNESQEGRIYHREYLFELPKELYSEWKNSMNEQKIEAMRLKKQYFSHLTIYSRKPDSEVEIKRIPLSRAFIERDLSNR